MMIVLYMALLLVGAWLSYRNRINEVWYKRLEPIQMWCLYFLLVVMGMRIGSDREILSAFFQIGLHASVFAVFSVAGSVLVVYGMLRMVGGRDDR
ncbi:LysO family transporter [Fusibacter paucivorans]|uniref:LysO family transporter n=1 Tax=Fusibacter paucivorans TaxID=76009 RepID=A0ABS5PSH6_9FIRM|nr:LysO family transporter [Fusibacter paucivorans]MBS7528048.1 LysO family transporter [Fusibacter paucivorans]